MFECQQIREVIELEKPCFPAVESGPIQPVQIEIQYAGWQITGYYQDNILQTISINKKTEEQGA